MGRSRINNSRKCKPCFICRRKIAYGAIQVRAWVKRQGIALLKLQSFHQIINVITSYVNADMVGTLPKNRQQYFDPMCFAASGKADDPMEWDGTHRLHPDLQDALQAAYEANTVFSQHPPQTLGEVLDANAANGLWIANYNR